QMEVFRRMLMAMAKDMRVIFLKLVLRLWKLKNLELFTEPERVVLARETMDIYAPVAARLGIYTLKDQLEDNAFKYLNPEEYGNLNEQLERFAEKRKVAIKSIQKKLKEFLTAHGFESEVSGRIKSIYSIFRKMERKGLSSLDDLYDVFAMRVVLPARYDKNHNESVDHLYSVLGMIHSEWKPLSRRFKDYIAVPKPNGYRSLHTVVLGIAPQSIDKPVEIQIRSDRMHKEAEYGSSSHWLYKEDGNEEAVVEHADWLKRLSAFQEELAAETGGIKDLKVDIFKDRIFVLTPRGEVRDLAAGATPIDFAYSVHTELGNKVVMAKVDGMVVPLDHELKNGNVVEVTTRSDATPKLQWLSFVKTSFAKSKIKAWFSNLNKETHVREGKRLLNAYLERLGFPPLDHNYSILKNYAGRELDIGQRERLVQEIGKGAQLPNDVLRKVAAVKDILSQPKLEVKEIEKISGSKRMLAPEKMVLVGGEDNLPVKLAKCCKPVFGDKIISFVAARGKNITVHKTSCTMLDSLNRNKMVFAAWKGQKAVAGNFTVCIRLSVISRVGLIRDITAVISGLGLQISDIRMEGNRDGLHNDFFTIDLPDLEKFEVLMNKLEQVPGVVSVTRKS
ncbi:MAG: RelA/SpoT family protein, partial [Candidatus Gracilibacteria bacterium]